METITSPANPRIKAIAKLWQRKYRKESGLFLAEGLRSVIEALDCGWFPETLVHAAEYRHDLLSRAIAQTQDAGGEVLAAGPAVLEKLAAKDNPQTVLGVFRQRFRSLDELDAAASLCVVALEEVRDPGNLGTIIRTVDGSGADGVILIGQCCDPYAVECVRATMGSLFSVPLYKADLPAFIDWQKNWPGTVAATCLKDDTKDYRAVPYQSPVLLIMGNEQAGISEDMQEALPLTVKLPMRGRADSLNLAVATGVMLYTVQDALHPLEKSS